MNFKILKQLARSNKYQMLYSRAKELSLKLFNNDTDLTTIQIWFLYWLEVYSSLYIDLARKEEFISEEVIEDDLRTEAYLLWRNEKSKKKSQDKKNIRVNNSNIPTVLFRSRK